MLLFCCMKNVIMHHGFQPIIYYIIRHRAYRHSMACCFLFSLFLQELPPELLPMSENLTEEREIHLSPAGVRQRCLKMWLCSVTIALCSVR